MNSNFSDRNLNISPNAKVINSHIEFAEIGEGTLIINSTVLGSPERPVFIGKNCKIISSYISGAGEFEAFSFGQWSVRVPPTYRIGNSCRIESSHIENSEVGDSSVIEGAIVRSSLIGSGSKVRPNANIYRSYIASNSRVGSEVSKTVIEGEGFTSEHQNSYLSLVAPARYPVLTPEGREELTEPLPNLTNIGAGTVFANYSGKPLPADDLRSSSGSQKGTAIVYSAFTAVNSIVVNRYGKPGKGEDLFRLLRRRDLTILGFASFVERKVTGRIPAFSYSGDTSAKKMKLGWVLDRHPGIVLNFIKKMAKILGSRAYLISNLIEGTIRLEIQLLREELRELSKSFFTAEQLREGISIFERHLDGRWKIGEDGELIHKWTWDEFSGRWICDI